MGISPQPPDLRANPDRKARHAVQEVDTVSQHIPTHANTLVHYMKAHAMRPAGLHS